MTTAELNILDGLKQCTEVTATSDGRIQLNIGILQHLKLLLMD